MEILTSVKRLYISFKSLVSAFVYSFGRAALLLLVEVQNHTVPVRERGRIRDKPECYEIGLLPLSIRTYHPGYSSYFNASLELPFVRMEPSFVTLLMHSRKQSTRLSFPEFYFKVFHSVHSCTLNISAIFQTKCTSLFLIHRPQRETVTACTKPSVRKEKKQVVLCK